MVSDLATGNLTREQFRAIEQEKILPEEPLAEEPFVDVHVDEPVDALNQEELMRQTLDPHYD